MKHQHLYRIMGTCLFLNNLTGITLNPLLTILACAIWGLGVPGVIFLVMYGFWTFHPRPRHYTYYAIISIVMMAYNIFIYYLLNDLGFWGENELFKLFNPEIFPILNIILCFILLLLAIAEPFRNQPIEQSSDREIKERKISESTKNGLAILSALLILLSLYLFFLKDSLL